MNPAKVKDFSTSSLGLFARSVASTARRPQAAGGLKGVSKWRLRADVWMSWGGLLVESLMVVLGGFEVTFFFIPYGLGLFG